MNKVIIIGCGFGGFSAIKTLHRFSKDIELTLIDKGQYFTFLPLLPDIIGRMIKDDFIKYPISELSKRYSFAFQNCKVDSIDLSQNIVTANNKKFSYDYLLISSGSQTNFYGNAKIENIAYKLDDADDAKLICQDLDAKNFDCYLVAGAGYTGIEIATNLRKRLLKKKPDKKIIIIERAPSILGPLPEWMKDYVNNNLKRLNIDVLSSTSINKVEGEDIYLDKGMVFKNAMLIWSAGVRAVDFTNDLNIDKSPQGRIKVDEFLKLTDDCFVVGDASYFSYKNNFLRMAVQFSLSQGECAAGNIIRSIRGERLRKYSPLDLGYIIPMANNKSCGKVLGVNLKGVLATFLHYVMCIYRSCGIKNRIGIIKNLIKGGDG